MEFQKTTFSSTVKDNCIISHKPKHGIAYERTCLANGSWSHGRSICQPKTCPRISSITNGTVFGGEFLYGSVLNFTCDYGFTLKGERSVQCLANETWSTSPPKCSLITCTIPLVRNGTTATGATDLTYDIDNPQTVMPFGSIRNYSCETPGHFMVGENVLECLLSGLWNHPVPQCRGEAWERAACVCVGGGGGGGGGVGVGVCVCVCVCVTMRKGARRMASTTSDSGDTSSKQ